MRTAMSIAMNEMGELIELANLKQTIVDGINQQIEEVVQVNIKNLPPPYVSARGDGSDDTLAFQDAATYINSLGKKVKLTIPEGDYLVTQGVQFLNEITIQGDENTWINFTGTGILFKLGKDGITDADYQNYKRFEVKNVGFRNGINMQYGLYFNKFVTQPRVTGCNFENFGNPTAWGIYFDNDCWDGLVSGCRWDSVADNLARNFITMFGRGNSRVRVYDNLITSLTGNGTAVYLNGFNNQIMRNKIEGFLVPIRLGGLASYSIVADNYFEKSGTLAESGCIEIGSMPGDNGDTAIPIKIIIDRNYCNTHLVNLTTTSFFIRPTKTTDLLKELTVSNNYVNSYNDSGFTTELIKQNNLGGQTGNQAFGNRYLNISRLNTAGANITPWNGPDALRYNYQPITDEDRYFDIWMGNAQNNVAEVRIRKFDGSVLYRVNTNSFSETSIYSNGNLMQKYFSDGRVGYGKSSIAAKHDFSGDVRADYLRTSVQKASSAVENGSLFESTDGNLYYKNLAGTVKQITT